MKTLLIISIFTTCVLGQVGSINGNVAITGTVNGCADAGSNDTYTCSISPAITAYVTRGHYSFTANTANTGAATVNFNSLGAKTIVKVAGGVTTTLADNDIRVGQVVDLVYDGVNMQMQSTLGNAPGGGSGTGAGGISFYFPGPIAAGMKSCFEVPAAATITGWIASNTSDATGSVQYDLFMSSYSTSAADPTVANTIVASAPPLTASARRASSTTLTGWTTAIPAKASLCAYVTSATTTAVEAYLHLQVTH